MTKTFPVALYSYGPSLLLSFCLYIEGQLSLNSTKWLITTVADYALVYVAAAVRNEFPLFGRSTHWIFQLYLAPVISLEVSAISVRAKLTHLLRLTVLSWQTYTSKTKRRG